MKFYHSGEISPNLVTLDYAIQRAQDFLSRAHYEATFVGDLWQARVRLPKIRIEILPKFSGDPMIQILVISFLNGQNLICFRSCQSPIYKNSHS